MVSKRMFRIALLVLLAVFLSPVSAQGLKKVGQSGMKWLSIPIGARGTAVTAYTALASDANAVFWNPAGTAFSQGGHLALNQTQWIADITVNAGAATYEVAGIGVFGVSFAVVDWGTLNGTRRADNDQGYEDTGTFSPENWGMGLSYARRLSDRFAVGGHVKYLYEQLGSNLVGDFDDARTFSADMNVVAFDIGTIYYTGYKDLRLAMTLQNFSQEKRYRQEYFPLPLTFKFGAAMGVNQFFMDESDHTLTFAAEAQHLRDYSERLHFGLEYDFRQLVFLRGGYKANYDQENLTLGAGLKYATTAGLGLALDYSYVAFENFDAVHMCSFDFLF